MQAVPSGAAPRLFIVDQVPLCIRHAADAVFPEDDMGAHHMAHAAYLRLQVDGVRGAY